MPRHVLINPPIKESFPTTSNNDFNCEATALTCRDETADIGLRPLSGGNEKQAWKFAQCAPTRLEEPMRRPSLARCAAVTVALLSISLISFPSLPSTIGLSSNPQIVNRELKGDRQHTTGPTPLPTKDRPLPLPSLSRAHKKVPVGCDTAFSSGSSPLFATVYGRCLV
jgi:hypothetical protein